MTQRRCRESRVKSRVLVGLISVIGLISAVLAPVLFALPIAVVNSTSDRADANAGDDVCDTGFLNSEGDSECTLRAALEEANADPGQTDIFFDIPTSDTGFVAGNWVIEATGTDGLPSAVTPVLIDATSQPGWTGEPVVTLDGSATSAARGLVIEAGSEGSEIRGLSVVDFPYDAIRVEANNTVVAQNFIGIWPDGGDGPIGLNGVWVGLGATGVVIGGSADDGNLIGTASGSGVGVFHAGTSAEISYNTIGIGPDGEARPTTPPIIVIDGPQGVLIDNNSLHNARYNALRVAGASNVTITNNEATSFLSDGIVVDAGSSQVAIGTRGTATGSTRACTTAFR